MCCPEQLTLWAERILDGMDDTVTPSTRLVSWFQNNLFRLNIALEQDFTLSGQCITPEMSPNISGIYEEMYYCDYLKKKSSSLLGGATFQDIVEIRGEEQGTIRMGSFTERSKALRTAAQDCSQSLRDLIDWYLSVYDSSPYALQVLYNFRDDPAGYGLQAYCPPAGYYSDYNTVWGRTTPYYQ